MFGDADAVRPARAVLLFELLGGGKNDGGCHVRTRASVHISIDIWQALVTESDSAEDFRCGITPTAPPDVPPSYETSLTVRISDPRTAVSYGLRESQSTTLERHLT